MNKLIFTCLMIGCLLACNQEVVLTFEKDISPIIFNNCAPCHYKGGPAPFSLTSYNSVAKRAKMITYVTKSGYMPPWPADPNYRHFISEKILSKDEIELINIWYRQGTIAGDTSKLDKYIPNTSISKNIGPPDLVIKMNDPFHIPGKNKDLFMIGKIPFTLKTDTNIRLIEFVPDNKELVHHVNTHLLTYNKLKENHMNDVMMVNSEFHSDSSAFYQLNIPYNDGIFPKLSPSVSNYLPGFESFLYPKGIGGLRAKKQSALLLKDIHFGPSPINQSDHSYFNIYFDKDKPKRPIKDLILGSQGISSILPPLVIAPNEIKIFETKTILNKDISLLTICPHMHLIGKSFLAFVISPNLDTIPLIKIDDWNFRWQYSYHLPKILPIKKGSTIKVIAKYDNTLNNLDNPFNPPQFIIGQNGSMKTTDEMLQLILSYIDYQKGDELIKIQPNEK